MIQNPTGIFSSKLKDGKACTVSTGTDKIKETVQPKREEKT